MSDLLVSPTPSPNPDGTFVTVTPQSAGWGYVGFEAARLTTGASLSRTTGERELCLVVVSGTVEVDGFGRVGGRPDPWSGPPDAVYVGPGADVAVRAVGDAEVGLCWAPAPGGGATARVLRGADLDVETRGYGSLERRVSPILMADREADSLLVCEVVTPGAHWSSYPPHKHDREAPPQETLLEETYFHRITPSRGFALQRVYTDDGALDEPLVVRDRDTVLVPRGYHTVAAPPGYDNYYLNVMAGPVRQWAVVDDPAHAWIREPGAVS